MHSMCILRILVELTEVQRYEHQLGGEEGVEGNRGRCGGERGEMVTTIWSSITYVVDNTYIPIHFSLG